jgi:hypothetical protein
MTDSQWQTVSAPDEQPEEIKFVFEGYGDALTGTYLGLRELKDRETQRPYYQARFRDEDNDIVFTRANASMLEGLERVRIGTMTRVTYTSDKDTGQASPMRMFKVETTTDGNPAAPAKGGYGRTVKRAKHAETKSGGATSPAKG